MNRPSLDRIVHITLAMACLFAVGPAAANENFLDPTRPPALLNQGVGAGANAGGPSLQSVLISPTRKVAIISGQTVRIGAKFGDATVVDIAEGAVVLRSGGNLRTLRLFPEVEKHFAHRDTPTSRAESNKWKRQE